MTKNTKLKIILLIAFMSLVRFVNGQEEVEGPYVDKLTIPFRGPTDRHLEVNLLKGSITIIGYEGDDVIVETGRRNEAMLPNSVHGTVGDDGMRTIQTPTGLYAFEDNNRIKVGSNNLADSPDLTINVPFETSIRLRCVKGDILVENVSGEISVETIKGDILVENVSGEINVKNVKGDTMINNVSGGVLATSVKGDIEVTFSEVYPDKPMSFTNLNGDINVSIPADTKAVLKLQSFNGGIKTDFDFEVSPQEKYGGGFVCAINGGGPQFVFSTHNGEIRVRKNEIEELSSDTE